MKTVNGYKIVLIPGTRLAVKPIKIDAEVLYTDVRKLDSELASRLRCGQ